MYGITIYWHKRTVRAGKNTLAPSRGKSARSGDPRRRHSVSRPRAVFEDWEADFGRTFVIGSDPQKLKLRDDMKLRDDICAAFEERKKYFQQTQDITASQLFERAVSLAKKFGWEFGGSIAGHLIGQFPHEMIVGDKVTLYTYSNSHLLMLLFNEIGQRRHWILKIHFVDRKHEIGGFFEKLLTIDRTPKANLTNRQSLHSISASGSIQPCRWRAR